MENLAEILIGKLATQPSLNSEDATITCFEAARVVRIARLEAKIEAYNDTINCGTDFTKGWLRMAKSELATLKEQNQL